MKEKTGRDIYLEYNPIFKNLHKALTIYLLQFLIFISIMIGFWWISSRYLLGALFYQIIFAFLGMLPFYHITINCDKLRKTYREKYGKLAYQKINLKYFIYTNPLGSASLYFPVLLKTNYYLFPGIISLPSHFITNDIFPFFTEIPISIFLIVFGLLVRRPSGGFDIDVDSYIYLIFPEKSRKVEGEIYNFIRHPRYLGRFFLVLGFGIFANNLLAISVAVIHSASYFLLIKIEDSELVKRFGESFRQHQKEVPALVPKYGNWRKFIKFVFIEER